MSIVPISSTEQLLAFLRENLQGQNLSIAGLARLCEVSDTSIVRTSAFANEVLSEKLVSKGFDASALVENGFNAVACWLVIEYFAYESKAKAPGAKQIARTFGSIGIQTTFAQLIAEPPPKPPAPRQLPPVRDTIEYIEAKKYLDSCNDPIFRSYAMQSLYEDMGAAKALPQAEERHAPIAVIAREMGFKLSPGQDAELGKWAKRNIYPTGKSAHGRYEVNTYAVNDRTREVVNAFFA